MSLAALPVALIVPPINVMLAGIVALAFTSYRRKHRVVMVWISFAVLFLLSLPIVSGSLIASLEREMPSIPPVGTPPQAIVILAGDVAAAGGQIDMGPLTLERLRAGAALARATGLPILVTGGLIGNSKETLSGLMSQSLRQDFQLPVRWTEAKAEDTIENATFSAQLLRPEGVSSIYLVTHAWHMKRSIQAFDFTGMTITAAPVRMDPFPDYKIAEFIPRTSAWQQSYYALHEWIGYAIQMAAETYGQAGHKAKSD